MRNSEFKKLDAYHRREKILDTACGLFAKNGYDATTTMELSLAIGCSETMLLGIFPTKTEIYDAIFEEWKVIVNKPPTLSIINDSPLDTLEKFFNDFISQKYSRDPAMRPRMERALYSRRSDGAKQRMYKVLSTAPEFVSHAITPLIKAAQNKGEIRFGQPEKLANFVWALIQGCYYSKKDFPNRYQTIPASLIRDLLKCNA